MKKVVLWHQVFRLYSLSNISFEDGIYTVCHNCCERIKFNDQIVWENFPHTQDCVAVREHLVHAKSKENEE
jgi:hypothetical protein